MFYLALRQPSYRDSSASGCALRPRCLLAYRILGSSLVEHLVGLDRRSLLYVVRRPWRGFLRMQLLRFLRGKQFLVQVQL
jgi:hypothetical protein